MSIIQDIKKLFSYQEPTYDISLSFVDNKPWYTLKYVTDSFYSPTYLGVFDSEEQVSKALKTHKKFIKDFHG